MRWGFIVALGLFGPGLPACGGAGSDGEDAADGASGESSADTSAEGDETDAGESGAIDPCEGATPGEGGYVVCTDGTVLRPQAESCSAFQLPDGPECPFPQANNDCDTHADCWLPSRNAI